MEDRYINIAIDGPAAAGKSSAAALAASMLGFTYVATGALYRAITLAVLRANIAPEDAKAVTALLPSIALELRFIEGKQHTFLNGEDVTDEVREPYVARAVSAVSAQDAVRAFLLEQQRRLARAQNCIMDGRDIGTVVLPGAQLKIFLTASEGERARRRYLEETAAGKSVTYESVLEDMLERDAKDAKQLRPAPDSWHLLSDNMTREEVAELIVRRVREIANK